MQESLKTFHLQEMNWLIFFPSTGNQGRKYLYYSVEFTDLNKRGARTKVCLTEIVDTPEFEKNYPHTVGYFKGPVSEKEDLVSSYLEIRIIRSIEDFWKFLNELDL